MTPQIDCLGKRSPVLVVSKHMYGVSKEIDGKMFIFRVNLGMWPFKSIILEKETLFWGFQHPFMGLPRRQMEKHSIFQGEPRHVTPQINCLGKTNPVLTVSTHISGDANEIDRKMFTFRVNLGIWPLKLIVLEKRALFWCLQHIFMGFPTR